MEYVIGYFVFGVVLLVIFLLRGMPDNKHRISGSIFLLIFWPLLVLVAGRDLLFPSEEADVSAQRAALQKSLKNSLENEHLDAEEKESIEKVIDELEGDIATFGGFVHAESALLKLWDIGLHPKLYFDYVHGKKALEEPEEDDGIRFSRKGPDWYIGFTDEFLKSIKSIDRKLQGRILEALRVISEYPLESNGNTVKPLGNQLKGLWRYRVGDYRLLYKPDSESKQILILRFSHRKQAYEGDLETFT